MSSKQSQYAKTYEAKNKARRREDNRKHQLKLKIEVINAYGGRCNCCGETHIEFLCIDHINNDGKEQRKQSGTSGGSSTYRWLKKSNYPKDGFQVLCWNCNLAKERFGYCPHNK